MYDNFESHWDRLNAELVAYPTLLTRAATTKNRELYRAMLADLDELLEEIFVESHVVERRNRESALEAFGRGLREGAERAKSYSEGWWNEKQ